jgi:DNA polymerase III subunit gamma/tau
MAQYQVLARKYRPQSFSEVVGQEAIVMTLKNGIKNNRLAHAYLFCGSRGTGKTTLARIFAKALNCHNPTSDLEPCNNCSSCKEITTGNSLDVLEIDGASHRGIDDIRQINNTVGYATSSGMYKIYIIDEVHMLTKEAFNALLKTLEEPPPKVKFFFATTEPHKVLPTILSRCQRFNLNRIPVEKIVTKLLQIMQDLGIPTQEEAIRLLAQKADGGLRDAESLLDQILAFHEGELTKDAVATLLGVVSRDIFFKLDRAGKDGNLAVAFEIAHQVFSEGKDLVHFVDALTEHFRNLILIKLSGKDAPFLSLSELERNNYVISAKLYSQEQCATILDFLLEAQSQIRITSSGRIALEGILLRIMRSHHRLPIEILVRRLAELEQKIAKNSSSSSSAISPPLLEELVEKNPSTEGSKIIPAQHTLEAFTSTLKISNIHEVEKVALPTTIENPTQERPSLTEDPTPSTADLGIKEKIKSTVTFIAPTPVTNEPLSNTEKNKANMQSRYDTILQFAAVELEGTIHKKQLNRH